MGLTEGHATVVEPVVQAWDGVSGVADERRADEPAANIIEAQLTDDKEPWIRHFDRLFKVDINYMMFRHLWNDAGTGVNMEPYLLFNLVLANDTPLKVHVTGCEGQATVDGDRCILPAEFDVSGQLIIGGWGTQTPMIKQPLLTEKGRELVKKIEAAETAEFSLGSMK